jgi:exodeoxyribonuclease-3
LKLATWNVNSLKVRLPHVVDWLAAQQPDVLCLQETKLADGAFPAAEIETAGYHSIFAGQKTYNGVAILSKVPAIPVVAAIPDFEDEQKRLIAADVAGTRVVCAYFPNGQAVGSDKYAYKLRWIAALTRWLADELKQHSRLVLTGDFNVAPEDRDVYDPKAWEGQVLCSEAERAAFRGLIELGLTDAFRMFAQPEQSYTWWDYRQAAFRRNMGLRIDHILLSPALAQRCTGCAIDRAPRKLERPSDHTPVIADFGDTP